MIMVYKIMWFAYLLSPNCNLDTGYIMSHQLNLAETVDSINKAEIERRVAISLVSTFYGIIFVYMIKNKRYQQK